MPFRQVKTSRGQGRAQRREIENLIRSRPMLFVPGEDGFDPKQEWADLFDEAWPATRAAWVELVGRCEKEYEERSALLKLFHVPTVALPPRRAAAPDNVGGEEHGEEEEREPPQLITHRLYPKKQQKMDVKVFKAARAAAAKLASDPQMRLQPPSAPKTAVGMRLMIYNEYQDSKGEPYFEWNPCSIVRRAAKSDRQYDGKLKKMVPVPSGWSCCEYDSAPGVEPERLWFRLGLRDFKQYHPGDGWCVNPSPDWATRDTPQVSDTGVGTVCRFRSNHPPPLCNALR